MTRTVTVAVLYDDELSDAYHVGQIDARNSRPRRIDLADTTPLAAAYHHGYDTRATDR